MLSCSEADLKRYIDNAVEVDPDRPVLVDKYMDRADELDVDALCDKDGNVTICGIMQHIEQAGVHSGRARGFSRLCPCHGRATFMLLSLRFSSANMHEHHLQRPCCEQNIMHVRLSPAHPAA